MDTSPLTWVPLVLSALALILGGGAMYLAMKARALATPTAAMQRLSEKLSGPEGTELLASLNAEVQTHGQRLRELASQGDQLANQLKGAVQKVGLERFDAEEGLGGKLSFSLVLLDARNHGLCLTSIHNLESGRIFVRGIVSGKTEHPMLPEEEVALNQALRG